MNNDTYPRKTNGQCPLFPHGHQECDRIHIATLEILERTGVDVHDEKARQILVAGGASADGIRIRIPETMVTRALDTGAPATDPV
jgi:trimethylamine:corrinoid methyltransferase-like protein